MGLDWMDKYMIGDDQIDAEHQEWFRLADKFLVANDQQSMCECGEDFSQYTRHHFHCEENLMRTGQFPFLAAHVKDHERLVSTLEKILDVVDQNVLSKDELEDFVSYCLVKHIATYDAPLAVYSRRSGLTPAI